jgi:hypothetical protein
MVASSFVAKSPMVISTVGGLETRYGCWRQLKLLPRKIGKPLPVGSRTGAVLRRSSLAKVVKQRADCSFPLIASIRSAELPWG